MSIATCSPILGFGGYWPLVKRPLTLGVVTPTAGGVAPQYPPKTMATGAPIIIRLLHESNKELMWGHVVQGHGIRQ